MVAWIAQPGEKCCTLADVIAFGNMEPRWPIHSCCLFVLDQCRKIILRKSWCCPLWFGRCCWLSRAHNQNQTAETVLCSRIMEFFHTCRKPASTEYVPRWDGDKIFLKSFLSRSASMFAIIRQTVMLTAEVRIRCMHHLAVALIFTMYTRAAKMVLSLCPRYLFCVCNHGLFVAAYVQSKGTMTVLVGCMCMQQIYHIGQWYSFVLLCLSLYDTHGWHLRYVCVCAASDICTQRTNPWARLLRACGHYSQPVRKVHDDTHKCRSLLLFGFSAFALCALKLARQWMLCAVWIHK